METEMDSNGTTTTIPPKTQRKAPVMAVPVDRPTVKFGVRETFNIDLGFELDKNKKPILDANGKKVLKERKVTGFAEPGPFTPAIDPNYVFPDEETKIILLGLEFKDRILLTGHTGTGKSSIIEQIAARLNYNVFKINFDGAVTRNDLIGEYVIKPDPSGKGSLMEFQYGILPYAFQTPGTIIILDEWDSISGECSFVLQRPLQKDDGKLLILETGGEIISLHPQNTIVATANTCGQGDDTGLYQAGTKIQNYAQLNRFGLTVKMTYLSQEQEIAMIQKRYDELTLEECQNLVKSVNMVREGYSKGELSAPLSPRDLINWGHKYLQTGDPVRSAKYCFLNRMPEEDAAAAESIIMRMWKKQ